MKAVAIALVGATAVFAGHAEQVKKDKEAAKTLSQQIVAQREKILGPLRYLTGLSTAIPAKQQQILGAKAEDAHHGVSVNYPGKPLEAQVQDKRREVMGTRKVNLGEKNKADKKAKKQQKKAAKAAKKAAKAQAPAPVAAPVEAEASGFAEDVQAKATEIKGKAVVKAHQIKDKTVELTDKAIVKATELKNKAVVKAGELKEKAADLTGKAIVKATELKDKVVAEAKHAHKWFQDNKPGFKAQIKEKAAQIQAKIAEKAAQLKNKVVELKDKVVENVKVAHDAIKNKLAKKPVEVEASGFTEDVQTKAVEVKNKTVVAAKQIKNKAAELTDKAIVKAKELKNKVVGEAKRLHRWVKSKVSKETPVEAQ